MSVGRLSNGQLIGAGLIRGDSRQADRQGDALSQTPTASKVGPTRRPRCSRAR